jgi:tetratricopeptide (TPR) repeat protein
MILRTLSLRGAVPAAFLFLTCAGTAWAQSLSLGRLSFPNSGKKEAQESFLRGVAALHSFWYEEAAEAFQEAQRLDPDFALAYWGEAMTYNHPLWSEQDIATARKVLARLGDTRARRLAKAPSSREKAFLEAVETLYGEGDKLSRDRAYSEAMERLYRQYPEDREAACFYALSLLGTVRPGDKGFGRQMKSAAILQKVFAHNPEHPGAAHYLIHSFDDPEHAPLGLPAANQYAEIAPSAHHALHMPSHIFVQLGMWDRVERSNKAAFEASASWVTRRGLSLTKKDYHSLEWRQYALLQLGRYREARELIAPAREVAEKTGDVRVRNDEARMLARYLVETRRWEKVPPPAESPGGDRRYSNAGILLAAGMSAAHLGDLATAEEAVSRLKLQREKNEAEGKTYDAKQVAIMEKEVGALLRLKRNEVEPALALLAEAAAVEESLDPPSGPPNPLKPSHELYGEVLLQQGRFKEAAEQFEKALARMPNRSASLLGLARSASQLGDRASAKRRYDESLANWHQADSDLPELAEVRAASQTTNGSH